MIDPAIMSPEVKQDGEDSCSEYSDVWAFSLLVKQLLWRRANERVNVVAETELPNDIPEHL